LLRFSIKVTGQGAGACDAIGVVNEEFGNEASARVWVSDDATANQRAVFLFSM